MIAEVSFQGELVRVSGFEGRYKPPPPTARRGKVTTFSKRSRKRLITLMKQLAPRGRVKFITLTYQAIPSTKDAKKNLRAFIERLRRINPGVSGIWRIEYQQRGAAHFHMLLFDLPYIPKEKIQEMWGQIINESTPFTRIEQVRSKRHAMSYVSKYIAKLSAPAEPENETEDGSGFISVPYLHAGRWWGFINKDLLPYAIELLQTIFKSDYKAFHDMLRGMRRFWRVKTLSNFDFFTSDAYKWSDYLMSMRAT
jgi:hypothetical protein